MSRTVFCRKYQKEMEGLDYPPMPGAKGEEIWKTVSKQAWQEWQNEQTMLINEKHLNMMDPFARKYLKSQMEKFLDNEPFDQAEGFVPPEDDKN
ncbi:Fe-S cluster biosynthesis and repair protein YggX [Tamilnaduibacter salinus]|uniref:Probable Fe(2+)-trafficking protein n=1 Tax=Tamilnaduibacter salinus TaxID=1484056 RepID=A0A2A2I4A9_9GAMM|nr:oxidative damage protection protein [Tamilnaduibacter salinus]PAV26569.1 oxidative damage protection protein [Tamilnaduibacter salinus]PVY75889.1 Fe-S cluster biosynthesis and repair protein YggX [Tamilnaduibacter salinus]